MTSFAKSWRIALCWAAVFVALGGNPLTSVAQSSPLTFRVWASPAPNRHTSDGSAAKNAYNIWVGRALRYAEGSRSNMGNPSSEPGAFVAVGTVKPREYMVTASYSWRARANPTGAFAQQHGNRMHFVLNVRGNGTVRFKFEDITWRYWAGGEEWGSTRRIGSPAEQVDCTHGWGYDWGADRVKGGADDTKVCDTNTTLVDELYYAGPGYGLTSDRCFTEPTYAPKCTATTGFTLQQVLDWYADGLNNSAIDCPMGMSFTIVASDGKTYNHVEKRGNPEYSGATIPAGCVSKPPPPWRAPEPAATPTPKPRVHTCRDLAPEIIVTDLTGQTQCQRIEGAGIGIPFLLAAQPVDAVDVWSWVGNDTRVCFQASGLGAVFKDSERLPHTISVLPAYRLDGYTCANIPNRGAVVLLKTQPAGLPPLTIADAADKPAKAFEGCMVTLRDVLNFRREPGGEVMMMLPANVTLTAFQRRADWFYVDYHGKRGWVSAAYVDTQGDCA